MESFDTMATLRARILELQQLRATVGGVGVNEYCDRRLFILQEQWGKMDRSYWTEAMREVKRG